MPAGTKSKKRVETGSGAGKSGEPGGGVKAEIGGKDVAFNIQTIQHHPRFDAFFTGIISSKASALLFGIFNAKRYTVKDSGISYRVINHWSEQGLLDDRREKNSKEWRKLSLIDILWLRILRELRAFGVPLETLRNAHQTLFFCNNKPYPALEAAFGMVLRRMPIFVTIFQDGEADIATEECIEFSERIRGQLPPFIRIPINELVGEILGNADKLKPKYTNKLEMNETEMDALLSLRSGEYDSVNMRARDGKIERVEKKRKVEGAAERIIDLLKETDFGEVTVKVENGKPVYTEVTKKEKK